MRSLTRRTLSATLMGWASFCRPSRGPTSTRRTCLGKDMAGFLWRSAVVFVVQGGGQGLFAALLGGVQFQLHLVDVQHLLLQLGAALGNLRQHAVELFEVAAGGVIQFDQLAALGQGKANALAAQDELQADLVAR
ncbi:hypothetical protein D9M71_589230 [compost metagenome]